MELLARPLRGAEFVAVDTETNGGAGDECELTEVGAVLVGGGELHDRLSSLVAVRAPVPARIERLTGIGDATLAQAPAPADVLPGLARMLAGRVLVAHSAAFDRRVLATAFQRAGLQWPDPPVLCTVALARRFAPLARRRSLAPLAESLGIDVCVRHRALPDAETCARIFCALFGRLCANAATVGEAPSDTGVVEPGMPMTEFEAPYGPLRPISFGDPTVSIDRRGDSRAIGLRQALDVLLGISR